jgi:hypothetical protein
MLEVVLPPQKCRWCKHDLRAGELFCRVCKGNRLVPARWWPVTAASMAIVTLAICAMTFVLTVIQLSDSAPALTTPVAATPALFGTAEQAVLPALTETLLPSPTPALTQALMSSIEPTSTPSPAPTHTPTLAPTHTPTLMPTHTPTLTPTHTATLVPTVTPTPAPTRTATPVPTATPSPTPWPVPDAQFRADQTRIAAGACTVLRWDVDGVEAVFLNDAGRPGHSTEEICPSVTRTYVLRLVMADGQQRSDAIEIRVIGSLPLVLNVLVSNTSCDGGESYSAEISLWAQGGDGQYTYYRDALDQQIGGPMDSGMVYRLTWRTCGGAPGTFIVRSGDGQEARMPFWVEPPDCCGKID